MIAVQTITYNAYLARTGNFDISTSHECDCETEAIRYRISIVKITENRVIVTVYLQELCYNLLVMNL